ncbi:hypothetical protein PK98_02080 [Croceibacterium mercuriale]|uniref:Uncharacterized protein n=1 Tax=Croceibacterium mercuriale TaxID=1572751 RepID=A0A0B2C021_9SPHN|nr:hypothetical protein PK98_02080 [Croceibacterium mercuriale]
MGGRTIMPRFGAAAVVALPACGPGSTNGPEWEAAPHRMEPHVRCNKTLTALKMIPRGKSPASY